MRKQYWFSLAAALVMSVLSFGAAAAQDKVALVLGEFVEGEITDEVPEVLYSFTGKSGDLITLEAVPGTEDSQLNPSVELRNADGETITQNEGFSYPLVFAIAELPDDGDYTVVVSRSGGAQDGTTVGTYKLRVQEPELVSAGSTINANILTDFFAAPLIYVIDPAVSGPIEFTFSQEVSENYAGMRIVKWVNEFYPETVANLDSTSRVSKGVLSLDLEAGNFYLLQLQNVSFSFNDVTEYPVTVEIK